MQRTVWRTWLAALVGGLALGCEHDSANHYPPDPLLVSKKPVEGKIDNAAPALLARSEPTAPTLPPTALAKSTAPPLESPDLAPQRLLKPPSTPVVRSPTAQPVVATPAVRRRVPGDFGHAADYSWLKGILDKRNPAQLRLRYSDSPDEEASGGIVHLEDDPQLAAFEDGDVILVEGELVRENGLPVRDAENRPHYRIRSARREAGTR